MQKSEDIVFLEDDNPCLFCVLKEEIEKLTNSSIDRNYLTSKELALVEHLKIKLSSNVTFLDGIEKCVNLKSYTHQCLSLSSALKKESEDVFYYSDYLYNLVYDLSPLYKCTKLEEIDLSDQRGIQSINLSYWKNLKTLHMTACDELRKVLGLDTFVKNLNGENKVTLNFGNCYDLKDIPNLLQAISNIEEKGLTKDQIQIIVPSFLYFKLIFQRDLRKLPKILENLEQKENAKEIIMWVENSYLHRDEAYMFSSHMDLLNRYLDEIIEELVDKYNPETTIEKAILAYEWIAKNVEYDQENLQKVDSLEKEEFSKSPLQASMRSSFVGIWNKKVVCVGYANLLTAFLIKLGLDARPVLCGVGDKRAVAKGETDHMITKVKTKLGDYYCDATTRSFNYFMLTKKELQEKNIFLIVAESPSYRTQSIREEITKLLNEKDKDTYRKGVIKAVNKIRKLVNSCFGIKDFEKLSTEQKENAKKIAEDMEKEKVFAK